MVGGGGKIKIRKTTSFFLSLFQIGDDEKIDSLQLEVRSDRIKT